MRVAYSYAPKTTCAPPAVLSDADEEDANFEVVMSKKSMKQKKRLAPAGAATAVGTDKVADDGSR